MGKYLASENIEVNGVCIHYAVIGEGRPVVLVHGNGESHDLFNTQIEQLVSAGYKVFAPDSRGHGANEPLTEYHYADMAEDMYYFINMLKLDKPAFYGHSDGGIIGLMLEMSHPGTLGVLAASGANLSPEGLDKSFLEKYTRINEESPDPLLTLMLTEPHIITQQEDYENAEENTYLNNDGLGFPCVSVGYCLIEVLPPSINSYSPVKDQ